MTALQASQHAVLDNPTRSESCLLFPSVRPADPSTTLTRQSFLEGMRQVAAAVTIVTTDGPGGRHGATVSAFTSVSADPPTVLVCLRSTSRIATAVSRNRVFTVSVLREQDEEVARAFAGEFDAALADRFEDISLVTVPGLAPGIAGATIFACTIAQVVVQHSHTIAIGHVAHVVTVRQPPLLYHDAAYRRLRDDCS